MATRAWSNLIGALTFQRSVTKKPRVSPDPSSSSEGAGHETNKRLKLEVKLKHHGQLKVVLCRLPMPYPEQDTQILGILNDEWTPFQGKVASLGHFSLSHVAVAILKWSHEPSFMPRATPFIPHLLIKNGRGCVYKKRTQLYSGILKSCKTYVMMEMWSWSVCTAKKKSLGQQEPQSLLMETFGKLYLDEDVSITFVFL